MRLFQIATIANDPGAYQAMRASMAEHGFDDASCRFTVFDNSQSNRYEPYQVLRELHRSGDEPYIVLCHQDLRFTNECSAAILIEQLESLDRERPRWALCGPAGADALGEYVIYMDDPRGAHRSASLPRKVISLDECFLVIRRAYYVVPSPGLSGYHLYGTDLCLNAMVSGKESYVIPFPVIHLSPGDPNSSAFDDSRLALMQAWRPKLLWGVIHTTCTNMRISCIAFIERSLHNRFVAGLLRRSVPVLPRWRAQRFDNRSSPGEASGQRQRVVK